MLREQALFDVRRAGSRVSMSGVRSFSAERFVSLQACL